MFVFHERQLIIFNICYTLTPSWLVRSMSRISYINKYDLSLYSQSGCILHKHAFLYPVSGGGGTLKGGEYYFPIGQQINEFCLNCLNYCEYIPLRGIVVNLNLNPDLSIHSYISENKQTLLLRPSPFSFTFLFILTPSFSLLLYILIYPYSVLLPSRIHSYLSLLRPSPFSYTFLYIGE